MRVSFFRQRPRLLLLLPRYLRRTFLLSLLIGLSMALATSALYFRIQPEVPLFYSLPRENQHLVAKEWLFLFPSLSLAITLIHISILTTAQHVEALLLKLFAWTTVGIQLILGTSLIRILLIIT